MSIFWSIFQSAAVFCGFVLFQISGYDNVVSETLEYLIGIQRVRFLFTVCGLLFTLAEILILKMRACH